MKLIKKLVNLSLIITLCLSCFGLVACNNSDKNKSANNTPPAPSTPVTLTLAQTNQICTATFQDLQYAKSLIPTATSSDNTINAQTSPIGIKYSDYRNHTPINDYSVSENIINDIRLKYEIFKSNVLNINNTYEYKVIEDDESEYYYMYLRVSSTNSSQIMIEWAETEDVKSATYTDSLLYKSILIHLDDSLSWKSIEVREFIQENSNDENASSNYTYIEKATSSARKYDKFTEVSSDYKYIDVDNIINKSISLDCSHPTVLTENQIKAKNYINSLDLTNYDNFIKIFEHNVQSMGIIYASDI